jgi:hypothetical protein
MFDPKDVEIERQNASLPSAAYKRPWRSGFDWTEAWVRCCISESRTSCHGQQRENSEESSTLWIVCSRGTPWAAVSLRLSRAIEAVHHGASRRVNTRYGKYRPVGLGQGPRPPIRMFTRSSPTRNVSAFTWDRGSPHALGVPPTTLSLFPHPTSLTTTGSFPRPRPMEMASCRPAISVGVPRGDSTRSKWPDDG